MAYKPIRDYGLISDSHTAALVGIDGAIDWLCWPRFDSPAIFCSILDDKVGGYFSIKPTGDHSSSQEYISSTNVLVTTFEHDSGRVEVTDFLLTDDDDRGLYRIITCLSGKMEVAVEFKPRPDYGRATPLLNAQDGKITFDDGQEPLELISDFPLKVAEDAVASGVLVVKAGDKRAFALGKANGVENSITSIEKLLEATIDYWREWTSACTYVGPWSEWITRSALVVSALTYKPTGLIVAAPTTSLPEKIGSKLNWDYRYMWLRDAAMVLEAMFHLGHMGDEGKDFLNFLAKQAGKDPSDLKIMYDIDGQLLKGEEIIPELEGYRGSYPVRIGNEASNQVQLDVFGEILLTAKRYVEVVGEISPELWESLIALADYAIDNWHRPDNGIWEERGDPRHYTHSKVMCAVGIRSVLDIQKKTKYPAPVKRWKTALKKMRETIIERAWNDEIKSFTKVFDSDEIDASLLLMSVYDFLPATDERLRSTVDHLIHNLGTKGLMCRFQWAGEEIGESEGAFTIASIWLAIHFIKLGKLDFAEEYIQALIDSANHVGLFAEELDPKTGDFLGNYPQLFVHTALIDAIHNFNNATRKKNADND